MRTRVPLLVLAGVTVAVLSASSTFGVAARPKAAAPAPAYTAPASPGASASGRPRPLILEGSGASSQLTIRPSGRRFVVLRSPGGVGELGERCTAVSDSAQRCRVGNVTYIGLRGLGGSDRIMATDGVHTQIAILGGKGRDALAGGGAGDGLDGGPGNDRLLGRSGGDLLRGRGGNDRLAGGADDDTVNGGRGRDLCGGGAGADLIIDCP
jgi:RTX calcium-binding nonapeptide repeat (4 copies)